MSERERFIQRLERALKLQQTTEGRIALTPTVEYCFECDEITVDELAPEDCIDHLTVSSDGYEHDGIGSAITALRSLHTDTEQCERQVLGGLCERDAGHDGPCHRQERGDERRIGQ